LTIPSKDIAPRAYFIEIDHDGGFLRTGFEKTGASNPTPNKDYAEKIGKANWISQLIKKEANQKTADDYFKTAQDLLNQVLKPSPNNFEANYEMGMLYINSVAQNRTTYSKLNIELVKTNDKNKQALANAQKAHILKQHKEALKSFQIAERIKPTERKVLIQIADIYAFANNSAKAKEYRAKGGARG